MIIKAKLNYLHVSPRKMRLVAEMIKGIEVKQAERQLLNLNKKSALPLLKLLKSAVANAHNNFSISKDSKLYITNLIVNQGPTLKRWRPRAFGRAYPLRKKSSHIIIELEAKEPKIETKLAKPQEQKELAKKSLKDEKEIAETKEIKKEKPASFFRQDTRYEKKSQPKSLRRRFFQRKAF